MMAGTPPISTLFSPLLKSAKANGVEPLSEYSAKCSPVILRSVPIGALTGVTADALGTWTVKFPTARSAPPCLRTTGPLDASSGTWTTINLSAHFATVAGRPLKNTPSPGDLAWPNPFPNSTTFVPTGPLSGSMRTEGMSVIGTALLTVYSTGAQQEPSGNGSEDASRTTTSPDVALAGISTSMVSSRQRRARTGTPPINTSLTPNIVLRSRDPAVLPKCAP